MVIVRLFGIFGIEGGGGMRLGTLPGGVLTEVGAGVANEVAALVGT